jgi:hypothetical protein
MTPCGYCGRGVIIRPPVGPAGSFAGFSRKGGAEFKSERSPSCPHPWSRHPGGHLRRRAFRRIPALMP